MDICKVNYTILFTARNQTDLLIGQFAVTTTLLLMCTHGSLQLVHHIFGAV